MRLEELANALNAQLGGEVMRQVDEETYAVVVDDVLIRNMEFADEGVLLTFADLGEPPADRADEFNRLLLQSMHMYRLTDGCSFSIDPSTGRIFLSRYDRLDWLDGERFYAMMDKFVAVAARWQRNVGCYDSAADELAAEETSEREAAWTALSSPGHFVC